MNPDSALTAPEQGIAVVERALAGKDLPAITDALERLPSVEAVSLLERLGDRDRAVVYRLLPKDKALEVFKALDATLQGHLVQALQDEDVAAVFAEMEPDDRVTLLDELPASLATRLRHRRQHRQPGSHHHHPSPGPGRRLPRDILKVLAREVRVGLSLGLLLGVVGFLIASWAYGTDIGTVIGLTLLGVCTMAATVGGARPLIGRTVGVDPAVFANPFITTFVDATGLLIYSYIAQTLLGLRQR